MRNDGRAYTQKRPLDIIQGFTKNALSSVLISTGDTKVLCTVSFENKVPHFLKGTGTGWVTAEYSLLPGSTNPRANREVSKGKASGRTSEIQRLIGRSLRAIIDMDILGERTLQIDADVLQADGGTRTAAITGSMLALSDAVKKLMEQGILKRNPIKEYLAAISVGIVNNQAMTDLCYEEDSKADVDMNIVMTESGRFVEIQGTAENTPFTQTHMLEMLDLANGSISELIQEIKAH
ncbi:MAG: ribonuclease PH [Candidatus Margulisbacteria bacterium]|nr:ribonuclease PH [Candidatus Margulisiibacteriota bacterium]